MKIYFASDHAGYDLKEKLLAHAAALGYAVEDCGPRSKNGADDYTDLISVAARKLSRDTGARAVFLGGSGQGEAMMGNRFKGVRAALFYGGDTEALRLSREHNDSNALSLGARLMSFEEATKALELWLLTPFSEESRHVRRIAELDSLS